MRGKIMTSCRESVSASNVCLNIAPMLRSIQDLRSKPETTVWLERRTRLSALVVCQS